MLGVFPQIRSKPFHKNRGRFWKKLGPEIQWVESYVTDDKIYCVYISPNAALISKHAQEGGFPANRISEVKRIIDPTSAEA